MPMQAHVEVEVQLQPIRKLGARREWMASTIAQVFTSRKDTYPLYRRLGGPWAAPDGYGKCPPLGFDLWTVHSVASCYTDHTVLGATVYISQYKYGDSVNLSCYTRQILHKKCACENHPNNCIISVTITFYFLLFSPYRLKYLRNICVKVLPVISGNSVISACRFTDKAISHR
jgi:hypothetical protein